MYNSQIVKERINTTIRNKNTSATKVLVDCQLSPNTINQMSDNKGLSSFSLAKIADYLDCSVDYLLGRTNEPQLIAGHSIKIEEIHGDHCANVNIGNEKKTADSDDTISELVTTFKNLSFSDKAKVMNLIAELSDKGNGVKT